MQTPIKRVSPAIFGLILICFFLPFLTVSCQSQKFVSLTLTGVQLATGTTIEQPRFLEGQKSEEKIPAEPLAFFLIVTTCVGLGTSFIKSNKSAIIPAGTGAAGTVLLLLLKSKIDNEVLKSGRGLLQVEYGIGFWISFFLFLAAAILNGFIFSQTRKKIEGYTGK
jgi:hypothetical protein